MILANIMACIVTITMSGESETFPMRDYRTAKRFVDGLVEGFDIDAGTFAASITCDPAKEPKPKQRKTK